MSIKVILCTLALLHTCVAVSDYCEIEKRDCVVEHIGCGNNTELFDRHTDGVISIRPFELTDRLRNEIFYKFNLFKNKIASGRFNGSELPSAARMKIINWNDELEYLAKLYAQKIPHDIHLCTLTAKSDATYYLVYQNVGEFENITDFIDNGIESFFNELKFKTLQWYASYFAETENIGCGIAEYTVPIDVGGKNMVTSDGDTIMVGTFLSMRCIFDTISESRDTYQFGEPCSLCKNTFCDEIFTSLCRE